MKKKLIGVAVFLFFTISILAVMYFIRSTDPAEKIYKNLNNPAKEQILSNANKESKNMTIDHSGIYEIITEGDEESKIAIEDPVIPPINSKFTGIYIEKNQSFEIPSGVTVKFVPVSFDNLGKNENFSLNALGKYFIGAEIYPGEYYVTLMNKADHSTDNEMKVQLIVSNKKKHRQVILNENNTRETLELKHGEFLTIKSSYLDITLNFEKIE